MPTYLALFQNDLASDLIPQDEDATSILKEAYIPQPSGGVTSPILMSRYEFDDSLVDQDGSRLHYHSHSMVHGPTRQPAVS